MSNRTYNNPTREPWNSKIHNILKTIDLHTEMHLKTGDEFHYIQSRILRQYVKDLKEWIHKTEK